MKYNRLLPSTGPECMRSQDDDAAIVGCTVGTEVTLHIYDVGGSALIQRSNNVLSNLGTGAFHAGVEIYGREWSFGATDDGRTGVFCCAPRGCDVHQYRKAVPMGRTRLSQKEALSLIGQLSREWPGSEYDLLRCNCCHFSDELLRRLGVHGLPAWVKSLAGRGAALDDGFRTAAAAPEALRSTFMREKSRGNGLGEEHACSTVSPAYQRDDASDSHFSSRPSNPFTGTSNPFAAASAMAGRAAACASSAAKCTASGFHADSGRGQRTPRGRHSMLQCH